MIHGKCDECGHIAPANWIGERCRTKDACDGFYVTVEMDESGNEISNPRRTNPDARCTVCGSHLEVTVNDGVMMVDPCEVCRVPKIADAIGKVI
jgi:hypothetical protein